jgi:hypothetical protein
MGPKGNDTGPAPSYTLAYFAHDVFLRPESCVDCTSQERADIAETARTEVVKAGEVRGLEVYDVNYHYQHDATADRSVIVRSGADEYREIFYGQPVTNDGGFSATKIIGDTEDQTLVWLRVDTGGNHHEMVDFLFRLNSDGATRVDLNPVLEIADSILPVNGELNIWAIELLARANTFVFRSPVYWVGTVEVDFRLDGDHLVPLGRRYIP